MINLRSALSVVVASIAFFAHAQNGGSITLTGGMSVSEGGDGTVSGKVIDGPTGPSGSFMATFDTGPLLALQSTRVREVIIPGATSYFSGEGTAVVRENGFLRFYKGHFFVLVDDLDIDHLEFPDQVFIQFRTTAGTVYTRHGLLVNGDIVIRLP